jgi:hypothetical protein
MISTAKTGSSKHKRARRESRGVPRERSLARGLERLVYIVRSPPEQVGEGQPGTTEPPSVVICPSKPFSTTWGSAEAEPTLPSLGFGWALAAKKVSAASWSAVGAHQPTQLRAVGQGGEGISQPSLGLGVEVPLARETTPASEEDQGIHLALGEGGLRAGPLFWRMGVAEVVYDNVENGEEGVLRSSMRSRFLFLRDRSASRL